MEESIFKSKLKDFLNEKIIFNLEGNVKVLTEVRKIPIEIDEWLTSSNIRNITENGKFYIIKLSTLTFIFQKQNDGYFIKDSKHGHRWSEYEFSRFFSLTDYGIPMEIVLNVFVEN